MIEYIHRFRNALVKEAELESYRLHQLGRWDELNSFPYGSCELASNFLAMYLKEKGIQSKVIWCCNELDQYSAVKNHVWLEVDDKFVDITISQFPTYENSRIYICEKDSPAMLVKIYKHCRDIGYHTFQERDIQLNSATENGQDLYDEIKKMADAG